MCTFSTSERKGSKHPVFDTFDFQSCFAPQRCTLFRRLNVKKWSEPVSFLHFWLGNVLRATTTCTFWTSQLPKVLRDRQFLTCLTWKCASRHNAARFFDILTSKSGPMLVCILTWKCASRHTGVHFFDSSTSKSALKLRCLVHFDFETRFAPQWRAVFHLSSGQLAPHRPL